MVGHGTRNPQGVAQLKSLVQQMEQRFPHLPIETSFLELAEPTIADGVTALQQRGVARFVTVPILLFTAGHAQQDIPEAVDEAIKDLDIESCGQSPALGLHPLLMRLSEIRFQSAIGSLAPATPTLSLAMVGRGARNRDAVSQMCELQRKRGVQSGVAWCGVGFFAVARPTVDELLEEVSRTTNEAIVVQPHLLFEGELMEQLREKVAKFQEKDHGRRWIMAEPLGADPLLADLFLSLGLTTASQWMAKSC